MSSRMSFKTSSIVALDGRGPGTMLELDSLLGTHLVLEVPLGVFREVLVEEQSGMVVRVADSEVLVERVDESEDDGRQSGKNYRIKNILEISEVALNWDNPSHTQAKQKKLEDLGLKTELIRVVLKLLERNFAEFEEGLDGVAVGLEELGEVRVEVPVLLLVDLVLEVPGGVLGEVLVHDVTRVVVDIGSVDFEERLALILVEFREEIREGSDDLIMESASSINSATLGSNSTNRLIIPSRPSARTICFWQRTASKRICSKTFEFTFDDPVAIPITESTHFSRRVPGLEHHQLGQLFQHRFLGSMLQSNAEMHNGGHHEIPDFIFIQIPVLQLIHQRLNHSLEPLVSNKRHRRAERETGFQGAQNCLQGNGLLRLWHASNECDEIRIGFEGFRIILSAFLFTILNSFWGEVDEFSHYSDEFCEKVACKWFEELLQSMRNNLKYA
ncbi:unnamed protein product [Notodromas monacha]|uniref:Uncharacterized protein n=1 Tax=Notodromas monacha TaxID=399045 RepID=A0A7R9BW46_9CRUS|nr:unnamed protein product [Notodromas monacha]CAG0921731.1 unnamed protein product [Notodromas monacha]